MCTGKGSIQWLSKRILSDVGADISQADNNECASQARASCGRGTLTRFGRRQASLMLILILMLRMMKYDEHVCRAAQAVLVDRVAKPA